MISFENKIETGKGLIILWQYPNYENELRRGRSKRFIERKAIKIKLIENNYNPLIDYDQLGAPSLINYPNLNISISHSKDWMVIYLSEEPIGVDVEHERKSLIEGSNYFVNDLELKYKYNLSDLQLIWGAKEAFFKKKGGRISDLKNEVTIVSIDYERFIIDLDYEFEKYQFYFQKIKDVWLVFT